MTIISSINIKITLKYLGIRVKKFFILGVLDHFLLFGREIDYLKNDIKRKLIFGFRKVRLYDSIKITDGPAKS